MIKRLTDPIATFIANNVSQLTRTGQYSYRIGSCTVQWDEYSDKFVLSCDVLGVNVIENDHLTNKIYQKMKLIETGGVDAELTQLMNNLGM